MDSRQVVSKGGAVMLHNTIIVCNNKNMLFKVKAMLKYWGYSFVVKGLEILVK